MKELERVRESERKLMVERERLAGELQKKDNVIASGSRQVDLMQRAKDDLMREVSDLRKQLVETKGLSNDSKNSQIRMTERLSAYDMTVSDLKEQLTRE